MEATTPAAAPAQPAAPPARPLRGIEKAAILCQVLGDQIAQDIMRHLDEPEQETLARAIVEAKNAGPGTAEPVLREFNALMQGAEWLQTGGIDYAKKLLIEAVGPAKAEEMLRRIRKDMEETQLSRLRKADPDQLQTLLSNEHPQIMALIMAHLDPRQCSTVLEGIPIDLATEVLLRMAQMDKVSPETLNMVEEALGGQAVNLNAQMSAAGGPAHVAEVLNNTKGSLEKDLLERITTLNAELSTEIKNRMFVFEDIMRIDDAQLQKILPRVEPKDLALSLKIASAELSEKIFRCMSKRAGEALTEEREMLGPVRSRDIDAAHARVIAIIRAMEEAGEVVISSGSEGDELVV